MTGQLTGPLENEITIKKSTDREDRVKMFKGSLFITNIKDISQDNMWREKRIKKVSNSRKKWWRNYQTIDSLVRGYHENKKFESNPILEKTLTLFA